MSPALITSSIDWVDTLKGFINEIDKIPVSIRTINIAKLDLHKSKNSNHSLFCKQKTLFLFSQSHKN
jgi:hypothetical protein